MKRLTEELTDFAFTICERGTRLPKSITVTMKSKEDFDFLAEELMSEVSAENTIPNDSLTYSGKITYFSTSIEFIFAYESD